MRDKDNPTLKIDCWGADLTVIEGLGKIWPHKLPLDKWPIYCGAGEGIGNKIIPDIVRGVSLSPACLAHDVEWAVAPARSAFYFVTGNYNFWRNMRSLMQAQISKEEKSRYKMAMHLCNLYAFAVTSPIGWRCFYPEGNTSFETNFDVKLKLDRLFVAVSMFNDSFFQIDKPPQAPKTEPLVKPLGDWRGMF